MRSYSPTVADIYKIAFPVSTLLGLFNFAQVMLQNNGRTDSTSWWHDLVGWLIGMYHSAALAPVIFVLGEKVFIDRRNWPTRAVLHGGFSFIFAAGTLASQVAAFEALHLFPALPRFNELYRVVMLNGFSRNVQAYWTILAIEFLVRYYRQFHERLSVSRRLERQAMDLEVQLAAARLGAMNMQFHPHFLFNTLNATTVLIRQSNALEAEEMVGRLSELLRLSLQGTSSQEVTLRQELEYVRLYLEIEQVRFKDRLSVKIDADPTILGVAFPQMALQPLIENAIRSIAKRLEPGNIEVAAVRIEDHIVVEVRNDGPEQCALNDVMRQDLELAKLSARLQNLYGGHDRLSFVNHAQGGLTATVALPYRHLNSENVL